MFRDVQQGGSQHLGVWKANGLGIVKRVAFACPLCVVVDDPFAQPHSSALSKSVVIKSMSLSPSTTVNNPASS